MGSAGGDRSRCARVGAMYLAKGRFLCLLDLDWSMKELGRMILKKDQEKERMWRECDRGKVSMLMGIHEVRTWRNQNRMGFRVPDIVAEETATGLYRDEKDVKRVSNDKTYHCDQSVVKLKNNTLYYLTLPKMKMKCHSQCFHRMAMRTELHQGVRLL